MQKPALEYVCAFVSCEVDPSVLVAMDIQLLPYAREVYVEWFDMTKFRRFLVEEILENSPSKLAFRRSDHPERPVYTFTRLTLGTYNSSVKDKLTQAQAFTSQEEIDAAFLAARSNP